MQLKFINPEIPVQVSVQVTENGKTQKFKFTAVFKRLDRDASNSINRYLTDSLIEVQKLVQEMMELDSTDIERKKEIDTRLDSIDQQASSFIRENFIRWEGLIGGDGKIIEYSDDSREEVLNEMLKWEFYFSALRDGLMQANGVKRDEAKAKN